MIHRSFLRTICTTVFVIFISLMVIGSETSALSPIFQNGDGQDEVRIDIESPQPIGKDRYRLVILVANPEIVDEIEIAVDNAELGQEAFPKKIIPVLGHTTVVDEINLQGQNGGDYIIKVRALDSSRRYFERKRQGFGGQNPRDLATAKLKYEPSAPEKPSFQVLAVNPDFDNGKLQIHLVDVSQDVVIKSYEGFILDSAGREVEEFSGDFQSEIITEDMPEALVKATNAGDYTIRLYLYDANGIRSDPQLKEFKLIPPPKPGLIKRIINALKSNPGILAGTIVIILSLVIWLIIKNKKSKKSALMPRPPIERTNYQPAAGGAAPKPGYKSEPAANRPIPSANNPSPQEYPFSANDVENTPKPVTPDWIYASNRAISAKHRLQLKLLQSPNYFGPDRISIKKFPFTIGRVKCDLTFKDTQITRCHLRIYEQQDQVFLEDLGSTNGTYVNGKQVPPRKPFPITQKITVRLGRATVFDLIQE